MDQNMNETRLHAYEAMHQAIKKEFETISAKMEKLKEEEKTRTATYRQLMGTRLTDRNILAIYRVYGLLD